MALEKTWFEPGWTDIEAIATDATYLYWVGFHSGNGKSPQYIGRVKLDGTEPEPEWITLEGGLVEEGGEKYVVAEGIDCDATYLYYCWSDAIGQSWIGRVKKDGTGLEEEWVQVGAEKEPGGTIGPLIVHGEFIYFGFSYVKEYLARVKTDGTGLEEEWQESTVTAWRGAILATSTHAYVASQAPEGGKTGFRSKLDGTLSEHLSDSVTAEGPTPAPVPGTHGMAAISGVKGLRRYFMLPATGGEGRATWLGRQGMESGQYPEFGLIELEEEGGNSLRHLSASTTHIHWVNRGSPENCIGRVALADLPEEEPDAESPSGEYQIVSEIGELPFAADVVLDSSHIYWLGGATGGTAIGRANLDGTATVRELLGAAWGWNALALDENYLYLGIDTFGSAAWIARAALDGTEIEPKWLDIVGEETTPTVYDIAVTETHIYWVAQLNQTLVIGRANLDGTGGEPEWIRVDEAEFPSGFGPTAISASATHLYFSGQRGEPDNEYFGRVKLDGTGLEILWHKPSGQPSGILVFGEAVFWSAGEGVARANLDGSGANEAWLSLPGHEFFVFALDSTHVYWLDTGTNSVNLAPAEPEAEEEESEEETHKGKSDLPYTGPRYDTPILLWPFRMADDRIVYVEQDTPREIAQCVAFICATEPGQSLPTPDLGLGDGTFVLGGVTEGDIVSAVAAWEPRAPLTFLEDTLVGIAQTVGIGVKNAGN